LESFLDTYGKYAAIDTNCVYDPKESSLEYLLGILNSKVISFVYSELFSGLRMSGGYFQVQAPQLRILPIIICKGTNYSKVEELSKKLTSLCEKRVKLKNPFTDSYKLLSEEISKNEDMLDEIVYKIYGIEDNSVIEKVVASISPVSKKKNRKIIVA
jgi:predicted P-loop ATPase/GTPase